MILGRSGIIAQRLDPTDGGVRSTITSSGRASPRTQILLELFLFWNLLFLDCEHFFLVAWILTCLYSSVKDQHILTTNAMNKTTLTTLASTAAIELALSVTASAATYFSAFA